MEMSCWRRVPLTLPPGNNPSCPWYRRQGGHQSRSGRFWRIKKISPCRDWNPRTASPYSVTIPTELLRFRTIFNTKASTYSAWKSERLKTPPPQNEQAVWLTPFLSPSARYLAHLRRCWHPAFYAGGLWSVSSSDCDTVLRSFGSVGEINIAFTTCHPK